MLYRQFVQYYVMLCYAMLYSNMFPTHSTTNHSFIVSYEACRL